MAEINDLLSAVIDKNPIEFSSNLADILSAKAEEAIAARKIEIASSLYGEQDMPDVEEVETVDVDVDIDLDSIDADAPVDNEEQQIDIPEDNTEDENA